MCDRMVPTSYRALWSTACSHRGRQVAILHADHRPDLNKWNRTPQSLEDVGAANQDSLNRQKYSHGRWRTGGRSSEVNPPFPISPLSQNMTFQTLRRT